MFKFTLNKSIFFLFSLLIIQVLRDANGPITRQPEDPGRSGG